MKLARIRNILRRALHPGKAVTLVAVALTVVGEVWCFALGGEGTPLSYAVYLLSAYALAVVVAAIIPLVRRLWEHMLGNRHVARIAESESLRAGALGAWAVLFDLAYAALILLTGFSYDSGWAIAVALYHVAIAGMGFSLAFGLVRTRKLADERKVRRELALVRTCGILLAVMAVALSGVMVQMVRDRQAWTYDEIVVIASAAFTTVNLVFSIRSAAKVRKATRPALVASRAISLSKTLVQIFFLETTMIAVFGKGDESFRFITEAITGAVVFAIVFGIAIALVVFASKMKAKARP